jgi:hypothetical protein
MGHRRADDTGELDDLVPADPTTVGSSMGQAGPSPGWHTGADFGG